MHTSRKRASLWWVSLALVIVYIFSLPTAAFAASKKEVKITVDGQAVDFDVQPYIDSQNRTIVPIRFIGEKLGYQFDWDPKGKLVTVTGNSSLLKIWINNKQALVNDQTVMMDTVAVLAQGRAMVPLRFIVENMGASISYDQQTGVVNVTRALNKNDAVEVSEVVQINSPVVNIRSGPGTQYEIVAKARLGDTFTVILKQDGWNQIVLSNGQKAWVIASAVDPVEQKTSGDQQRDNEPLEQVTDKVAVISESVVNIRSGPGTDYPVLTKASLGASFNIVGQKGEWYEIAVADNKGWVAGWLVSVREKTTDSASRSEEPGERREEVLNPQPSELNTILGVEVETEDDEVYLTISGQKKLNYSSFRLDNPRRIVLDFPGSVLEDPNSVQTIEVDHDLVHTIRVAQFNAEQVRVVIDLAAAAGINLVDSADDGKVLEFRVGKPSIKGKTIVLDPGHASIQSWGNSDPGAIGPSGLQEKDVVLDIAQKTAELLRAKGANVILTRVGDTTLTLAGRAEVANKNNADIFVSIHCNANTKSTVQGTSTYYYNNGNGQADVRKKLASVVQSELVKAIGTKNLGVLQANFAVLRYTAVPSILVETAFISNPEEENLLADSGFRTKIAQGIANGIELYFSE